MKYLKLKAEPFPLTVIKGVLIVTKTVLRDTRIMRDNLRMTDNG